jgi:DNA-binding GntR family transcriptional regulator
MGVSRTPVREAFQELQGEGLITLRMNKGAIVNNIDRKFVQDIFETRILMESEAAARAAGNGMETDALLSRLYELRDHFEQLNKEDYIRLNQDIHMSIWNAADNHQLKKYLLEMWNGPSVSGSREAEKEHYRYSTREHIAILLAIRDGKEKDARKAMAQHITRSMNNLLEHYSE